jgi:hypothetical protein
VQDVERNVLRHGTFARHVELEDRDDVSRSQLERRLARRTVDENLPGFNRPLERGAAKLREPIGEKNIQPSIGSFGRDRE